MKIFVPITIAGFAIIVPINMTDNGLTLDDTTFLYSNMDRLTIANVRDKSNRFD